MGTKAGRNVIRPKWMFRRFRARLRAGQSWHFFADIGRLIWEYRLYGLVILVVTIVQELVALWPVQLLGEFVDRLQTGDLGNVVWLFFGASLLYPAIVRANVILRHKMFYETDYQKRVELTLQVADEEDAKDAEAAGSAHTSLAQAVSGVTNGTYHLLGSFTPVIIKIIIVSSRLVSYNVTLGATYVASLIVPVLLTVLFNHKLRVLRDTQYSVVSTTSGAAIKAIVERENQSARDRFLRVMRERRRVLISLVCRSQTFLYARQAFLVGSQFLVVAVALMMRNQIGLTQGDFTQIIGYTTQVGAAFLNAVAFVDNIVSYSRAYHVHRQMHLAPADAAR